jgi:hypothetical protein
MERLCSKLLRTATRSINVRYVEQRPKSILTLQESRRVAANISPLKPSGNFMYRQFSIQWFYVLLTVYLRVLCGSENKQRLFHFTVLTDKFL